MFKIIFITYNDTTPTGQHKYWKKQRLLKINCRILHQNQEISQHLIIITNDCIETSHTSCT